MRKARQISEKSQSAVKCRHWTITLIDSTPLLLNKIQNNTSNKTYLQAEKALEETLRFMYLCAHSKTTLTPSVLIDSTWHEFILFTRSYHKFCIQHFNHFIHHQPSSNKTNELQQYERTILLYEQHFGYCDDGFWPRNYQNIAPCGPCENE